MRLRRLSFIAGWAAVVLLALAGFAAFGTPESTVDELESEAAAASVGHASGAQAGLAFAVLSGESAEVAIGTVEETPADGGDDGAAAESTEGSIASDTSGWLSQVQVRELVSRFFTPEDVNKAVRVAWCESRFDPNSTNLRTGAVGLFQHLPQYWEERASQAGFTGADPTDPEASTAAAAWAVYNEGGWDIFTCQG